MQILLKMKPEKPLIIPLNYNYQLQSALYAMLGEVGESDFWHDNGFGDIVKYKGFCFSRLEGKYIVDKEAKKIAFENNVYLEIRSSIFEFIDAFQRAIEQHPFIKLYDTRLNIVGASLANQHFANGNIMLRAATPIVVHESLADGHTHFFSPAENEFYIRICNNIVKKYETITGDVADEVFVRPIDEFKKEVTLYKDYYITGYKGAIEFNTSLKMAEFIYNTGIGEKNSQGFGFVKIKGE